MQTDQETRIIAKQEGRLYRTVVLLPGQEQVNRFDYATQEEYEAEPQAPRFLRWMEVQALARKHDVKVEWS